MAEKKNAVVLLTPGFPENEQDTTCLPFLQQYVRSFISLYPDIELRVIAFQYPFKKGHYKWNGVNVYSAGGKGAFYSRLFAWKNILKELKQIEKQNGIAVVHSYWLTECTLIGQRFARKRNIKHIGYAIGQDVLKSNRYLKLIAFSATQIVAMSESIAKRYHEITGYKVTGIIPAGIDIEKVTIPNEPRTIDIIGVGALTPLKNYMLFTYVISILKKDFPELKALIIGKGEQESVIREKINKENLQENIQLIGEISHDEVFRYMNRSKIFLHTSSYEGQSTVIMEALAMGLNIVCFDIGRIDHGKINVCGSKEEIVQKLRTLLSANLDFKPQILLSSEDTVKEFMKVYGL